MAANERLDAEHVFVRRADVPQGLPMIGKLLAHTLSHERADETDDVPPL
jgi:hypothetical protein